MTEIHVEKNDNESNASLLRRFSRKIKNANVIRQAKNLRYRSRPLSELKKKQSKLSRLKGRVRYEYLAKWGKLKSHR